MQLRPVYMLRGVSLLGHENAPLRSVASMTWLWQTAGLFQVELAVTRTGGPAVPEVPGDVE
jgi:hypothetical protein